MWIRHRLGSAANFYRACLGEARWSVLICAEPVCDTGMFTAMELSSHGEILNCISPFSNEIEIEGRKANGAPFFPSLRHLKYPELQRREF